MPKFNVRARVTIYYRGTVEAANRTELELMDYDELDLEEYDSSAMEIDEIKLLKDDG